MSDNIKKIIEFQTNSDDFKNEIETIKGLINEVVNSDTTSSTFSELEGQAHEIENVLSILKNHGMESTVEFSKLKDKIVEIANSAKTIDESVGRLSTTTIKDLNGGVSGVVSEMQLLENQIQNVLNSDSKSQTFEGLLKQQKALNDLLKQMKKEGLDNTKQFELLENKFVEIRATAKQIGDNVGWASGETYDTLASKMGNAISGTQNIADGVNIMGNQAVESSDKMGKLYNSIDFLDRTTTLPISGALGEVTGLLGFATQAMSEFNGANNASKKAQEAAKKAQDALNVATLEGRNTTDLATRATQLQEEATNATTNATKGFKAALASIGIGLLIAALGLLIENWDKVSKAINDFLPVGFKLGDMFNSVKTVVYGFGNAIIQYALTPIKSIVKLIQGDFRGAMNEVKNGLNVIGNYKKGVANATGDIENDRKIQSLKDGISYLEKENEVLVAAGNKAKVRVNEAKMAQWKVSQAYLEGNKEALDEAKHNQKVFNAGVKKDDDDAAQKRQDDADNRNKQAADKQKQANEKAKQENERKLAERNATNKKFDDELENLKNIQPSARENELYKLKKENEARIEEAKKTGADLLKVAEIYKLKEAEINEKYNEVAKKAIEEVDLSERDEFDIKADEIEDKYNKILLNIDSKNVDLRTKIINQRDTLLEELAKKEQEYIDKQSEIEYIKILENDARIQERKVANIEENFEESKNLSIQKQIVIANELEQNQIELETIKYEAEQARFKENKDELARIEQEHNDKIAQINADAAKTEKILKKEKQNGDLAIAAQTSNLLNEMSDLAEENSIESKALGIASATISTYVSAISSFRGMVETIPGPAGIIAGTLAATAAVISGFKTVKKIAAVKVGNSGGGGSVPNMTFDQASFTAPQIEAASASASNSDVRVTNSEDFVIKTYILDSDIEDVEKRKNLINNLSGF